MPTFAESSAPVDNYIGAWLSILQEDNRAIFRAASQASRAAQYLMAFLTPGEAMTS
jgi:antirestriction protein ArdC